MVAARLSDRQLAGRRPTGSFQGGSEARRTHWSFCLYNREAARSGLPTHLLGACAKSRQLHRQSTILKIQPTGGTGHAQLARPFLQLRPLGDVSQVAPHGSARAPGEARRNLLVDEISIAQDQETIYPILNHAVHRCRRVFPLISPLCSESKADPPKLRKRSDQAMTLTEYHAEGRLRPPYVIEPRRHRGKLQKHELALTGRS
jgi:hypothetical protein